MRGHEQLTASSSDTKIRGYMNAVIVGMPYARTLVADVVQREEGQPLPAQRPGSQS